MLRTANLEQALSVFREAVELMKQADDPIGQFYTMSQLGQQMRSQDFDAGFAMQQEAYRLFRDKIATKGASLSPELKCQLYVTQNLLGLAQFDRGNYSESLELMEASIAGFREIRLKDGLAEGLNYLGQLYMSMGQFEKAETAVKEAIWLCLVRYTWSGNGRLWRQSRCSKDGKRAKGQSSRSFYRW
jgi:tetratricopeptide (TPR) repeat protein